jgi:thiol-disulfide isomerase/thioredoxin
MLHGKPKPLVAALAPFLFCTSIPFDGLLAQQAEYFGTVDRELVPEVYALSVAELEPASPEEKSQLPIRLSAEDQAFFGKLHWHPEQRFFLSVVLVEPARTLAFLYADVDFDGGFTSAERFSFSPVQDDPELEGEIRLALPIKTASYRAYPLVVRRYKAGQGPKQPEDKRLLFYSETYVQGKVDLQGRQTLVRYGLDLQIGKVDPSKGRLGIDCNRDGKISRATGSPEWDFANDETIVFRVGDLYVSTGSVDLETSKIVLRSHHASDYQRIELSVDSVVPDFSFTDFNGKGRRLSEYRGKHVLLEFWATWCGPCVWEIPNLQDAYRKYQSRGFEILGLDNDEDFEKTKAFVAEKGIGWTQASRESIKDLITRRFRINSWPTTVLLDPDGKVISLGDKDELPLMDKGLLNTLKKILPSKE